MTPTHAEVFRLDPLLSRFVPPPVASLLAPPLEHLLSLRKLERTYAALSTARTPREFAALALDELGVRFELSGHVDAIPTHGPLVLVANHPFGGLEGLFLYGLLAARRDDVRVLGNGLLSRLAGFRPALVSVDVLGGRSAVVQNANALRKAVRWVSDGGALVVFPAGEVASLDLAGRTIADPPWHPSIGRLIRLSGARVLPVYVDGANSPLFHAAGLVHARLRTALLARELLNKRDRPIAARVGRPLSAAQIAAIDGDGPLVEQLRLHVYAQACAVRGTARPAARIVAALPPAPDPAPLAAEIALLSPARRLASAGELEVWHAASSEVPHLMQEIGRLRELTFRAAGEGTGRERDVDLYDSWYQQLFVWNRASRELVGGYRIGHVDRIVARYGLRGLYTRSLFDYPRGALPALDGALELGRSFVRPDQQKSYTPLLLLWKGIAAYVCAHPRYRVLFGPVSISNDYSPAAHALLTGYLRGQHGAPGARSRGLRPRHPLPDDEATRLLRREAGEVRSLDALDTLLGALEPDGRGVPVLLRQYLKLGARVLSFNVDPAFGHSVDVLVQVDLARADRRLLDRYMGREGAQGWLARHAG